MSLYEQWQQTCEDSRTSQVAYQEFWNNYFELEKETYQKVLTESGSVITGTVKELAEKFGLSEEQFIGFLDGANESFLSGAKEIEDLKEEDTVSLDFDFEKLYFNMHKAKADWLFNLKEWEGILTADRRKELTKEFRASQIFVREIKVGRNDPCPCGSGKKYKNCCGKNA